MSSPTLPPPRPQRVLPTKTLPRPAYSPRSTRPFPAPAPYRAPLFPRAPLPPRPSSPAPLFPRAPLPPRSPVSVPFPRPRSLLSRARRFPVTPPFPGPGSGRRDATSDGSRDSHAAAAAAGPNPRVHVVIDGKVLYRDVYYEKYQVAVELDGRLAHPDEERWRDSRRDNTGGALGIQTCRYGWRDVVGHPCETAQLHAQILERHGWLGQPRPCSRDCPVGREELELLTAQT
jgi:hypothetical protein